jgi:hypothetical protein
VTSLTVEGILEPTDDATSARATGEVTPLNVDGVWIFVHESSDSEQARYQGTASIRGECLFVDDMVVLWHKRHLTDATWLVREAAAGRTPPIDMIGGSLHVPPPEVTERCDVESVYYNGADAPLYKTERDLAVKDQTWSDTSRS